jgi:DNA polymerase-3 subunit gamma/tau
LTLLAHAADGSVRDGLSLLDQLIAFGGGRAGEAEARAMLGTMPRDEVARLAEVLARGEGAELLRCAQALAEFSPDYGQLLDELASLLVRVGLRQAVPGYQGDELYASELLERLGGALTPEDVQLFYQTAITGRRDLPLAPEPRSGFEMTLLRMLAFRPAGPSAQARPPRVATTGTSPAAASAADTPASAASAAPAAPAAGVPDAAGWSALVAQLELAGAARQLASHCVFIARQGAAVRLGLDPRNQLLRTPATEEKLQQALARHFGAPVRLEFQSAASGSAETPALLARRASDADLAVARQAFEEDPGVRGLRERFGATVLPETVRPVK